MAEPTHIVVRGAAQHNLRGVDVEVPRDALVVFTGVSGSGKSSLAFDTIFQEGQRRFMESLSAYARQFLGQMERPKVESVEGVSPTLSIDQKTVNRNPRSTVGTVTEIYDHVRLLMARLGQPHCPECGTAVQRMAVDPIVDRLLSELDGQRVLVLGPVVRDRKGEYRAEMERLHREGWLRARVDGAVVRLESPPELARYEKHTIEVVVDRLRVSADGRSRLAEAVERAVGLGDGVVTVVVPDTDDAPDRTYSTERGCPHHPEVSIPELEPRLFSFNAPQGACPTCSGLGALEQFDESLLIDRRRPAGSALLALNDQGRLPFAGLDREVIEDIVRRLGAPSDRALREWPRAKLRRLLHGDPTLQYRVNLERGGRVEVRERTWRGLIPAVETVWKYTRHAPLARFRRRHPCPDCGGERLNAVSRAVTFRGRNVPSLARLTVREAHAFFASLELEEAERVIGEQLFAEIRNRLAFLDEVGLGYLSLDRSAATLSGGEAQRIRLAAQVGSALEGVTYVLDEPSIGLHARDNRRLLTALRRLRDRGNSVIVVEHDAETMLSADWMVDVGPGAGREGGEVVASGPPRRVLRVKRSLTAQYLRGDRTIAMPTTRREPSGELVVRGAALHNLRSVEATFPLGTLTTVTGVSGSGKSTLVFRVLEAALRDHLAGLPVTGCELVGADQVDKLIRISQQPIGRTPRSNPATYTGVFDTIRELFAATPEARVRGYKKGRFSFNVAGGRCESCMGAGVQTVEMQFLPSVEVVCDVCLGRRFNSETLEITWGGRTIADVLALTVGEALEVFSAVPRVARILGTMAEVGLSYVPLGQPSTTLSGGEAQRVKLATELHRPATGKTLYLLDEPTTGLHFDDVAKLILALQRLVDAGNTVIVVEHHTDVIKCADHVVDLGPEGGDGGGCVVGEGPPEAIALLDTPTGRVLAELPELAAGVAAATAPTYSARSARRRRGKVSGLVVRGARLHNLQDVDVDIPHGQLTVITGPSGSGKTSLAFDTIFAEGQRQYVESLSTYARRFLGRVERPPVDRLEGLQPAIAIDQRAAGHNPRSTVATVTEIHDVLRLLYAKVGQPHCPECQRAVRPWSPSDVAGELRESEQGVGWILAQLRPISAEGAEARRSGLLRDGWTRLLERPANRQRDLSDPSTGSLLVQGAWLVVDRVSPGRTSRSRLSEAVSTAFALGDGRCVFVPRRDGEPRVFTVRAHCPEHGAVLEADLTPRHFSFNSQLGACVRCGGLGVVRQILPERLIPQPDCGFWDALDGRVSATLQRSSRSRAILLALFAQHEVSPLAPWVDLPEALRHALLHGVDTPVRVRWTQRWGSTKRTVNEERDWPGLFATLEGWSSPLDWLIAEGTCPDCRGGRLRPELLAVTIGGQGIDSLTRLPVAEARDTVAGWQLEGAQATIAERPLLELRRRLGFLVDVGLGYLGLDRAARTLSGGESQRIRLASQLGSMLTGVTYVLDEPTIGLHPRDTERLLGTLEGLRDLGNTVVVVEHDLDTIRRADRVVDLGPGAGIHGGRVLASGTPAELASEPRSVTGRWLSGEVTMPLPAERRPAKGAVTLVRPRAHNVRAESVTVPLGVWVAVAGVSGSGKSSLVMDTLVPALARHIGRDDPAPPCERVEIDGTIDRLVVVDQSPIGRTPRSTPATYTKVMDALRTLYASTTVAQEQGWKPTRFSYNSPRGGRCTVCEGRGAILVEMHFLPDVWVTCEACGGHRFDRETLRATWKGRSIADVLSMRCDEALELFANHRRIARRLQALVDVGLGYLQLGQPANTLSGGEAQRVKLASELASRRGHVVYVLDEPTTGLHLDDVVRLVDVFHRLVGSGHTVITIEHHLDILRQADHLLELGPEGGDGGGLLVSQGPPDVVARADTPTGAALRGLDAPLSALQGPR